MYTSPTTWTFGAPTWDAKEDMFRAAANDQTLEEYLGFAPAWWVAAGRPDARD